ncbi:uncharacterized protein LOC144374818 isoform X2 [Ictidomys tridecemlineatus]
MAPAVASGSSSLPSYFATFPDLLFVFEFMSGVFSYIATLLYVVHAMFSLIRWKSS